VALSLKKNRSVEYYYSTSNRLQYPLPNTEKVCRISAALLLEVPLTSPRLSIVAPHRRGATAALVASLTILVGPRVCPCRPRLALPDLARSASADAGAAAFASMTG